MYKFSSNVSLFLACILAAYAVLGLLFFVPDLIGGSSLIFAVTVAVVIVVVLFAIAIILKGLACLFKSFHI